jgi:hypothetical protein
MPEIGNLAYGGPGSAMSGPLVGALVPFVLGPFTTATTVVSGAGEIGIKCPCDLRLESVTWAFMTAPGAASTLAIYNHTATNGGAGGTLVLAAQAITAEGGVEGTAFASSAVRNFTKGQFIVLDPVIGTSAPVNMVVTIMAYISGHAVADVLSR